MNDQERAEALQLARLHLRVGGPTADVGVDMLAAALLATNEELEAIKTHHAVDHPQWEEALAFQYQRAEAAEAEYRHLKEAAQEVERLLTLDDPPFATDGRRAMDILAAALSEAPATEGSQPE